MSLLSPNPAEREATLRRLVRGLLDDARVTSTAAARHLGRTRQLLDKQLRDDEACYLRLSDLPVLERLAPGLASELLEALGLRVVPDVAPGTATDILAAVGMALHAVGKVTSETTEALADGVDGAEATRIGKGCDQLRRMIAQLEASVAAAVVRR